MCIFWVRVENVYMHVNNNRLLDFGLLCGTTNLCLRAKIQNLIKHNVVMLLKKKKNYKLAINSL